MKLCLQFYLNFTRKIKNKAIEIIFFTLVFTEFNMSGEMTRYEAFPMVAMAICLYYNLFMAICLKYML